MNGIKPSEIYCVVDYNLLNSSSAIVSLFDSLDGAKKECERMNQDFNREINLKFKRKYPFIERYRAVTLEKGMEQIVEYINDEYLSSQEPGY